MVKYDRLVAEKPLATVEAHLCQKNISAIQRNVYLIGRNETYILFGILFNVKLMLTENRESET
jgi:hypothetical protein